MDDRRPGRPRAAHPPGPLPGRDGRAHGARRVGRPRLPRAAAGDLHRPRGGVGRADPRAGRSRPGIDAFEKVADFAKSAKGYAVQADMGHVTIVVDRATRELVGAAMACPDASAAIHECVVAIKAHVTDRRPGRDDPRVPVDVPDLQWPVRRGSARARQGRLTQDFGVAYASKTTRPSITTIDGRAVARAPPGSTGSRSAAGGRTTRSARWPTTSRPRSVSRAEIAGSRQALRMARSSGSASCGPNGARPGGPARILAGDGQRDPGPRVERLDRRVGPERENGPGRRDRGPGVAVRFGSGAPQPRGPGPRRSRGGSAGRWPRCRPRRTGRDRPGRAAGRARSEA